MSKKIIFAIIIFVFIIGGAFWSTKIKSNSISYKNELIVQNEQSEKLFKDTDNDGLKDWEEELWGTDINKKDTDVDKTDDFTEVREGRSPIIKGPNDKLSDEELRKKINPTIEADLNETDKFSRELFAKYINAKQNGDVKSVNYGEFLSESIEKSEKGNVTIYKETDLKKVDNSEENLRKYGNLLGKIIRDKAKEFPKSELEILDQALPKEDAEKLKELDIPIQRYNGLRDEMLRMEVPEDILKIHTRVINLLGLMSLSVENMKFLLEDPVRSISGVSMYPTATDFMIKAMGELGNYFISKGIIFDKDEDGYDVTKGV